MHARAITAAILCAAATGLTASHASAENPPTDAELGRATEAFLARTATTGIRPGASGGTGQVLTPEVNLPTDRVVAFYGAPQMSQTVLGMNSAPGAFRRLAAQASPYLTRGARPVVEEIDLVSVFATAGRGADGLYRTRQSDEVIGIYLARARAAGARLMLDIQPGRSTFGDEIEALEPWISQPDVDVALDPEWNVGRRGIPGDTPGSVTSGEVNAVSKRLQAIVREGDLSRKQLVVHQFRRGMVRGRTQIKQRSAVDVILNFDGIGSPAAKAAGYEALSAPDLFNGFSLFYQRDQPLMKPAAVLRLVPEPDFLLYQ